MSRSVFTSRTPDWGATSLSGFVGGDLAFIRRFRRDMPDPGPSKTTAALTARAAIARPSRAAAAVKTVRAVSRTLRVLAALNELRAATVVELAAATSLSRATIYRLLETLIREGYVVRDEADNRFRPTVMVRGLSDGFDDYALLAQAARGPLMAIGEQLQWPVALSSPSGAAMAILRSTDRLSPLAVEKHGPGYLRPMLQSAGGLVYLAFCPRAEQAALIDILLRSGGPGVGVFPSRSALESELKSVRELGFAVHHRPQRLGDRSALAVPVLLERRPIGVLVVRYARKAVADQRALAQFLPPLRTAAHAMEAALVDAKASHAVLMPPVPHIK